MRRRALIFLLAVGTIAGYSSGFASVYRWHRYGHGPGGFCHHGRSYAYDPRTAPEWAPPQPAAPQAPQQAQAPQAQAQAPLTDAPGEPGPR